MHMHMHMQSQSQQQQQQKRNEEQRHNSCARWQLESVHSFQMHNTQCLHEARTILQWCWLKRSQYNCHCHAHGQTDYNKTCNTHSRVDEVCERAAPMTMMSGVHRTVCELMDDDLDEDCGFGGKRG